MSKPRILTGDTPTSTGLHLGHYVGSLENRLNLQSEYDCYFLVANVHAFTTLADKPEQIRANTIGIVKDWLAVGLDRRRPTQDALDRFIPVGLDSHGLSIIRACRAPARRTARHAAVALHEPGRGGVADEPLEREQTSRRR